MTEYLAGPPQDTQPCSAPSRVHESLSGQSEEHSTRGASYSTRSTTRAAGPKYCLWRTREWEGGTENRAGGPPLPQSPQLEAWLEGQKDRCLGPLQAQPAQQPSGVSGGFAARLLQTHCPSGHRDTHRRTPQHLMLLTTRLLQWGQRCFSCSLLDLCRVSRTCHRCYPSLSHDGG